MHLFDLRLPLAFDLPTLYMYPAQHEISVIATIVNVDPILAKSVRTH
jgi:hypothetical protein